MLIDDSMQCCSEIFSSGKNSTHTPAQKAAHRPLRDEVDEELLPLLLEETNELYPRIRRILTSWREHSGADLSLANQLQRNLHTFKGSARMAGAMRLGELAHRIEGRIADAIMLSSFDAALWIDLETHLNLIGALIEELTGGEIAADAALDVASPQARYHELRPGQGELCFAPLSSVNDRLYRVARQTAKELGKRVNFELLGSEIELHCAVLDKMTAPFEHLLRNAIAHGIETPEQRKRIGKPAIGQICLSLQLEGNGLVFKFSDDGAGLNMPRLKQKAIEHGVLMDDEEINEEQAIQMIFKPGLSTAQEVTEISGRGIGLDVVINEVSALGGRVDVIPTPEKGLSFIICLPSPSAEN